MFAILLALGCQMFMGCNATNTTKGGAIGAGVGGAIGGAIGHRSDNTVIGAIIGATVGGARRLPLAHVPLEARIAHLRHSAGQAPAVAPRPSDPSSRDAHAD